MPPTPALVAAGRKVNIGDIPALRTLRASWQTEAWDYYHTSQHLKFAARFVANSLSKLRLTIDVQPDPRAPFEPYDPDDAGQALPADRRAVADQAVTLLADLWAPSGGQAHLQSEMALNFEIAGEVYLVDEGDFFDVRSVSEVSARGTDLIIKDRPGDTGRRINPDETFISRLWVRDPQWSDLPDSLVQPVLGDIETLLMLTRQVRAEAASRLNAGAWLMPESLKWQTGDPTSVNGSDDDDPFSNALDEALTEPIGNVGSARAASPFVIWIPDATLRESPPVKVTFDRPSDQYLEERISQRVEHFAEGIDLPTEVVRGKYLSTFCADKTTECLTRDGWRTHDQIREGDDVYTLDHATGVASWQPATAINRFHVTDEPMLHIDRKSHSSLTTAAHRWPVILADNAKRTWRTSAGRFHTRLNTNHRLTTAAPSADLPETAKWSDDFVEMVAWFYTEGHINRTPRRALGQVCQSAHTGPGHAARIHAVLTRLLGPPTAGSLYGTAARNEAAWAHRVDKDRPMHRFVFSAPFTEQLEGAAPDKVPTATFVRSLTAAQLELFLQVSGWADGWTVNSGTRMFSQSDPARLDAYELAVILSGRTPSRWSARQEGTGSLAGRWFTQHYCSMTDRQTVQPISSQARSGDGFGVCEWVPYTGVVWCPTTANGTWLARRNGSVHFTGNSNASQVDRDIYDDHLEHRAIRLADSLTSGYLHERLLGDGDNTARSLRWLRVGFDPSALLRNPAERAETFEAHDRILISDEAARRRLEMPEADAPDDAELERRLALKRGVTTAEITAELLRRTIAPTFPDDIPAPPPVTAASGPQHRRVAKALADIDQGLFARLLSDADSAVRETLRAVGGQLRSRIPNGQRDLVASVPLEHVAARMGRALVAQVGDPVDDDIAGLLRDRLAARYDRRVSVAQREAVAEITETFGDPDPLVARRVAGEQSDDRDAGLAVLLGLLVGVVRDRLFAPTVDPPQVGEFDDTLLVPPTPIRAALARAGGATGGGDLLLVGDRPAGQVAQGERMLGLLSEAYRTVVAGWVWRYGDPSSRTTPFEAHRSLNGVEFDRWDDDVLRNFGDWPPVEFFRPSDHMFCLCTFEVVLDTNTAAA